MCEQMTNGGGKTALFGKADTSVVPKALPVEVRRVPKGVPLAMMGVAPEIADLLEEATDRNQGVAFRFPPSFSFCSVHGRSPASYRLAACRSHDFHKSFG